MSNKDLHDNCIRSAIDECLSGVEKMPSLRYQVLQKTRGDVKVKKKLSAGLVIAICLIIVAVGAFAAMSLNTLYEKTIELESKSGLINEWSIEDKVTLIDWMAESGIQIDKSKIEKLKDSSLSEDVRDSLSMEIIESHFFARDGYLTAMDLIADEYGPYEFWSLELKAWYSSLLEKYDHEQINGVSAKNVLPGEDDITEEEAKQMAQNCLTEIVGLDVGDIEKLHLSIYFQEVQEQSSSYTRHWSLNYYGPDKKELLYYVYLKHDGTLRDCGGPEEYNTIGEKLNEEFRNLLIYHQDTFFTVEGLAAFAQDLAPRINEALENGEQIGRWPTYFAKIPYALPSETSITEEQARQAGVSAILAHYKWSIEELNDYYVPSISYRIYNIDESEWRLSYRLPASRKVEANEKFFAGEIPFCIIVRIDDQSGEILELRESFDQHWDWYGE